MAAFGGLTGRGVSPSFVFRRFAAGAFHAFTAGAAAALRALVAAVVLATAFPGGAFANAESAAAQVPVPDDYRMDHYRSPTPRELPGATVVGFAETRRLIDAGAVWLLFVESAARAADPPRPWLVAAPKVVIPGSIWLPNVGKGAPEPDEIVYFQTQLTALKARRPDVGFLFYCYVDCWVSWNAARRALRLGYGPVYWYPDGVDGWILEDQPTERIYPAGRP